MVAKQPVLRRHKSSGHAYARFDGRQVWFGPYGSPGAHERFARTLTEWLANGCRLPAEGAHARATVSEVVERYFVFAERTYCMADGRPTREVENLRDAVRPLLSLYGSMPIRELGVRQLKTLREQLIERGLCRKTINDRMNRIRRVIAWAAEEELCGSEVLAGAKALQGLRRCRSRAREGERVRPVAWEQVEQVLGRVSTPVAGLLELMWHTGMRPGEACQLRPVDLDRSGPIWFYRPRSHKTQHLGRDRVIAIGPRGQAVLRRFLARVPPPLADLPLFSPRSAIRELHAGRRTRRKTPLWRSHLRAIERKRRRERRKEPGEAYTPNSLRGAVHRAARMAGAPLWSPNQLRHAAASRIRREIGLEAARAVLGHASAHVTEIYAEMDQQLAGRVMGQLG